MNEIIDPELHFIFGRRSIRKFTPEDVGEAAISRLLQAAMAAPSAAASDPWRFIVVRKRETLEKLAAALPFGKMLTQASVGFVICGDLDAAHDHQLSYLLQDCSAAIENLLLCAHALGLGGCWLGVHPREDRVARLKEIFSLPQRVVPVSAVAIGLPGESKDPRTRFNPAYVHRETW
ncbi:MAG: nitroreductase family protein [Opitutaceae bacterium]|jgi:nitroreductase